MQWSFVSDKIPATSHGLYIGTLDFKIKGGSEIRQEGTETFETTDPDLIDTLEAMNMPLTGTFKQKLVKHYGVVAVRLFPHGQAALDANKQDLEHGPDPFATLIPSRR